uniref:Ig-like domain-containing protein n=1 Tax=Oryzias melastigma TaxID=30732 RepID=A0A3B3BW14_ORYME
SFRCIGGEVIAAEGDSVTLSCTFKTSTSLPRLFWYKQVNSYLKYMLRRYLTTKENSPEFKENRFDAEVKDKSIPLTIHDLHVSDSAVYYCLVPSREDQWSPHSQGGMAPGDVGIPACESCASSRVSSVCLRISVSLSVLLLHLVLFLNHQVWLECTCSPSSN